MEDSLEAVAEVVQEVVLVVSEARREVVVVSLPVDAVVAEADSAREEVDSAVVVAHLEVEEEEDEDSAGERVACSGKEYCIGMAFRGVHVRNSTCAWLGLRTTSTFRLSLKFEAISQSSKLRCVRYTSIGSKTSRR